MERLLDLKGLFKTIYIEGDAIYKLEFINLLR